MGAVMLIALGIIALVIASMYALVNAVVAFIES